MKHIFRSLFVLLAATVILPAAAQVEPKTTTPQTDDVYVIVEEMPEFPGGKQALGQYLGAHITYPAVAQRNGLEGLVVLSFVVDQQGNITDIEPVKRLGGGTDEEAIRVVKSMPRWKPGKQNGRYVKTRFTLPIRFEMADPEPVEPTK